MTKSVQDRMVAVARVRDDFHAAVYGRGDVEAAVALATAGCALVNLPSGCGAEGVDALRRYLAEDVVLHLPADLAFRRVSRTGDRWRVAQEDVVTFTHDRELPWLLPGVAATGRRVEVLAVSVVTVAGLAVASHRTLWDHATLASQLHAAEVGTSR